MFRRLDGRRGLGVHLEGSVVSKTVPGTEFSHVVQVDRVGPEGILLQLSASSAQRETLARQLQIPAVLNLSAQVRVVPDPVLAGHFLLKGQFEAEVEQTCVVSLEPVRQHVGEAFLRRFAPSAAADPAPEADGDEAEWLDPEAEDPPEPLQDGAVDAGAVVAEALALALDPYPRKPGAGLPEGYRPDPEASEKVSPFAALKKLKVGEKD